MKIYKAPWSTSLIVVSVLATLLCLVITFGVPFLPAPKHGGEAGMWLRWLPLALVFGCALFTVRSYTIAPDAILVQRLLWATRLPRAGLKSAEFVPKAMCRSLRTCGNGGFFSFTGFYWSKTLKSYRAYVMDLNKTVVLRYERRTVVVSPDSPADFVRELLEPLNGRAARMRFSKRTGFDCGRPKAYCEPRYRMTTSLETENLLRRVSRSFYLSLRLLPGSVRPTLGLAYLLARASDSIADAASASIVLRGRLLEGLPGTWAPGEAPDLGPLPASERSLLESLPQLLRQLDASPDREEILDVWKIILAGQIFDLERFGPGAGPLTIGEAVRYTGLVAGCVGKFWTRICFKHVPGYSEESPEAMCGLGYEFGCGLQWVNILRDRHADAAAGRVYVTREDFPAAMRAARENLAAGSRYAVLVRPRRLRAACRLPLEIGCRTLDLVGANPLVSGLKVSRAFVWLSLARALWH